MPANGVLSPMFAFSHGLRRIVDRHEGASVRKRHAEVLSHPDTLARAAASCVRAPTGWIDDEISARLQSDWRCGREPEGVLERWAARG